MCADDIEMINFMKKHEICTKNYRLYNSMAVIYEKNHEFKKANQAYLEGLDNRVSNHEALQQEYKKFEERMENRINREISSSMISSNYIEEYLRENLLRDNFHDTQLNENNKRVRDFEPEHNFMIKKKKIHFFDTNKASNLQTTVNYGQVPVYVDEPFRKNIITKGTRNVEIYELLVKLLLEKDEQFKMKNEIFLKKLKEEANTKPLSWVNGLRIHPEKMQSLNTLNNFQNPEIPEPSVHVVESQDPIKPFTKKDDSDKLLDMMGKMKQEIIKKQENSVTDQEKGRLKNNLEVNAIYQKIKNEHGTPEFSNQQDTKSTELTSNIANFNNKLPSEQTQSGIVVLDKGEKFRIIKVETSKVDTDMFLNPDKLYDAKIQQHVTLTEMRAKYHMEKLQKLKQAAPKKRQTIIFKFDSDGDACMSSEKSSPLTKSSKKILENPSKPNFTNNAMLKKFDLSGENLTLEQVNDMMMDIGEYYAKGLISSTEKNKLLVKIEEKITQFETNKQLIENKYQKPEQKNNQQYPETKLPTFGNFENNQHQGNLFKNGVKKPDFNIKKHYEKDDNEIKSYLEPYQSKKHITTDHINDNYNPTNVQPLINNLLKPVLKESPEHSRFSSISKSLDFTNIKLLESNKHKINYKDIPGGLSLADNMRSSIEGDQHKELNFSFDSDISKINNEKDLSYKKVPVLGFHDSNFTREIDPKRKLLKVDIGDIKTKVRNIFLF